MSYKVIESSAWPPEGPVSIWQEPLRGHTYVIGADVAEGLEHGDFSVGMVLDVDGGLLVAEWHDRADADLFGEQLSMLGYWYNTALIGVEINSIGHVTVTALRKLHYPRLFRRRVIGQVSEKFTPQFGWRTDKASKPQMIEGLTTALREGVVDIRCEYTLAELRTYVREYTAGGGVKTHGSPYDDRVMALAIAVQMLGHAHLSPESEKPDDRHTLDWWLRQAKSAERRTDEVKPLGQFSVRRGTGVA